MGRRMKLLHTADLHIGKMMFDFSLYEDQEYILNQILDIAKKEQVDVIVLAGDIYDRSIPSAEAVTLFDTFLTGCVKAGITTMVISGNHDSPERLSFGEKLFEKNGLYIAGNFHGQIKKVELMDAYGKVNFYLLPFVRPGQVGAKTEAEGVEKIIKEASSINKNERNVLITHYFVGGKDSVPETSESENIVYVGGIDMVSPTLFKDYDYVALGHIHKSQKIGQGNVYYSGTPLAYSFSEGSNKSVRIVELKNKEEISVKQVSLIPLREVRTIKGNLWELVKEEVASLENREDYIRAILTNEEALMEPMSVLRSVYPNAMEIVLERKKLATANQKEQIRNRQNKAGIELFQEFYQDVQDEELSEQQLQTAEEIMKAAMLE